MCERLQREFARRIDWDGLLADLDERETAIVQAEAEGRRLDSVARQFNVSSARISQQKNAIADRLAATWGRDAPAAVAQKPRWRKSLRAGQEKYACRQERPADGSTSGKIVA